MHKGIEDDLFMHIFNSEWIAQNQALTELIAAVIPTYFMAGVDEGKQTIGVSIDFDLLNPNVQQFLDNYTASEVTMIDATTRSDIKRIIDKAIHEGKGVDEVAREISNQYKMFGKVRPKLIAHNEIAQVHSQAEMLYYRESGVVDGKSWLTANDGKVSQGCMANQDQGVIPLNKKFQSGHDAPPRHPRCRCVSIPEVAQ